jgi:cytochrome b pre-mRNA-processing protein 3
MLRFLFRGLTERPGRGRALFDRAVSEARQPHWYEEGQVPDTIDGRFATLATICALLIVRLEQVGEAGDFASAALTERFIEAMDSEHRELGLNDPGLGRRVRKLVGSLERRVDDWRAATASEREWDEIVETSLYRSASPSESALDHSARALSGLWSRLAEAPEQRLVKGDF